MDEAGQHLAPHCGGGVTERLEQLWPHRSILHEGSYGIGVGAAGGSGDTSAVGKYPWDKGR